jgi:hypothetical protein
VGARRGVALAPAPVEGMSEGGGENEVVSEAEAAGGETPQSTVLREHF